MDIDSKKNTSPVDDKNLPHWLMRFDESDPRKVIEDIVLHLYSLVPDGELILKAWQATGAKQKKDSCILTDDSPLSSASLNKGDTVELWFYMTGRLDYYLGYYAKNNPDMVDMNECIEKVRSLLSDLNSAVLTWLKRKNAWQKEENKAEGGVFLYYNHIHGKNNKK